MAKTNRSGREPQPKRRRPTAKVVAGGPSPALIATFVAVGVLVAAIIGYAVYALTRESRQPAGPKIAGLANYRASDAKMLSRNHVRSAVAYRVSPPVGGDHNPVWQKCMGDVYPAAIANENAVHSLEHGAVWITYRPDLPPDQVETLARKARGTPYLFMSPYPGLNQPISLQAWGYQLKLDSAADPRADQFIRDLRAQDAPEPNATCSNGVTATGTAPHNTPGG